MLGLFLGFMLQLNHRIFSFFLGCRRRLDRFCISGNRCCFGGWSAVASGFLLTTCFFFALAATNFTRIVRRAAGAADRWRSRRFCNGWLLLLRCRCLFFDGGFGRDVRS